MAVTHTLYGPFMKNLSNAGIGGLAAVSTEFTVFLMSSDFAFSQDHEYWAQVSSDEQSTDFAGSTEYVAGGKELTERSLAYAARVTTFSASTYTSFSTGGNISGFFAVLAASSYLVSCVDFDGEEKSVAGEFKINWTDSKVLTMTVGT